MPLFASDNHTSITQKLISNTHKHTIIVRY